VNPCPYREHHQNKGFHPGGTCYRIEIIEPHEWRCRLTQEPRIRRHDPEGVLWVMSGGPLTAFKGCYHTEEACETCGRWQDRQKELAV
jgi:hypothetical protein